MNEDLAVLTVPAKDEFAEGILELLLNQQRGSDLGKRAQLFMQERYSVENYVESVNSVYHAITVGREARYTAPSLARTDSDTTVP